MYKVEIKTITETIEVGSFPTSNKRRDDDYGIEIVDTIYETRSWRKLYIYKPDFAPAREFAEATRASWNQIYDFFFQQNSMARRLLAYGDAEAYCSNPGAHEAILCLAEVTKPDGLRMGFTPPIFKLPVLPKLGQAESTSVSWSRVANWPLPENLAALPDGEWLFQGGFTPSGHKGSILIQSLERARVEIYPHSNFRRYGYEVGPIRGGQVVSDHQFEDRAWETRGSNPTEFRPLAELLLGWLVANGLEPGELPEPVPIRSYIPAPSTKPPTVAELKAAMKNRK